VGTKKLNISTCSKNELDLFFAKLKQDFANDRPMHVLDCERVYMPVMNVSEQAMKEKHYFESAFKIKKSLWDLIQVELQLFKSAVKLFQKWKNNQM
jgi:hypothetical protein